MRIVAAIPACGLLAGCAVGLWWPEPPFRLLLFVVIASVVASVAALRLGSPVPLAVMVAVGFTAGAVLLEAHAWREAWRPTLRLAFESLARAQRADAIRSGLRIPEDDTAVVTLTGVLRQDASPTASGVSVSLNVQRIADVGSPDRFGAGMSSVEGGVILSVSGMTAAERAAEWRRGRTVTAVTLLRRPARYLDPGVADQEKVLARRGTTLVGSVKSGVLVEVLDRGSPWAELAASVRAYTRRAIGESVGRWSSRSAGIVTAIVIGDRSGLDEAVEHRLQQAGTYHVIAISGGNIAILAGLTLLAFRYAGLLGRVAMITAIIGLLAYAYVVGGGASVDRATLMAVVYFAGRAVDLRGPPLNALALVAGLLVLSNPLAVSDPGFLLTFGATGAILATSSLPSRASRASISRAIVSVFTASLAAEIALLPVAAGLFSRITVAGLVLNFAAIPLMAVAQIAGMLVIPVFAASPVVAHALGAVAHVGAEGLVRSGELVDWVPWVTWRVAPPAPLAIATYYTMACGALVLWTRRHALGSEGLRRFALARRASTAIAAAAGLWIAVAPHVWFGSRGDGRLHVTFVDVGQGDCIWVRLPAGRSMLIDTGGLGGAGSFDIGERVVAPVLRERGVRRLDTVVLTHGDTDHIGGAPSVLAEFRPFDVWEGIPVPPLEPLRALRAQAERLGIRWANVHTNDRVALNDVTLVVRHPDEADWERQKVRNDDSIVLELLWRDVSIVLTGDVGREVERSMAERFGPSPLRAIKVPHHGSLTSSDPVFVRALAPRLAVVSVGRSNTSGHPAPAVLQRYREIGAEVFRTDRDGAVTMDTDGTSLNVHTFVGRSMVFKSRVE